MTIDTKKLRELAEAATRRPDRFAWSHYSPNCDNHCDCYERAEAHAKRRHAEPFHAAADPQTVIALLDRNAELEDLVSAMRDGLHRARLTIEEHVVLMAARDEQLAAANAEIERLTAEQGQWGAATEMARTKYERERNAHAETMENLAACQQRGELRDEQLKSMKQDLDAAMNMANTHIDSSHRLGEELQLANSVIKRLCEQAPRCGARPPVPWFAACASAYGHSGMCQFPPLQSLYSKERCDSCGNDRAAWNALLEALAAMTKARNEACKTLHDIGSHDDEYGYAVDVAAELLKVGTP